MKRKSGRRRWAAGALHAGRAAAFLTLVTGINGTIAALEPRYEPIYIYLLSVVIVGWFGGALLGVTAALASVVVYDTVFAPVKGLTPSLSSSVPLAAALGTAIVTQLARSPLRRRLTASSRQPLLETTPPKVISVTPAIEVAELENLRQQLAEAQRQLSDARAAAEKESRVRMESAATARARLADLQHELDLSRTHALEQARKAAAAEVTPRNRHGAERLAALEREIETTRNRTRELEAKLSEAAQELEVAWRRVDEEKARSDAESARLQHLERTANEALQNAVADLASRYEQPLAEAKKNLAEAFTRIPVLESERDAATARADQERAERLRIAAEFDGKMQNIVARITIDYKRTLAQITAERETARTEARSLREQLEQLQKAVANQADSIRQSTAHVQEQDRLRAKLAEYTGRLQSAEGINSELNAEIERLRAEIDEVRGAMGRQRSEREEIEAEHARQISELDAEHERALRQAQAETEFARAEVRTLAANLEAAQEKLSENADAARNLALLEEERDGLRAALQAERDLVAEYTARITESEARAAALLVQIERAENETAAERSRAAAERAEHERVLAGASARITALAQEKQRMTADRESARAELQTALKNLEAERQHAEEEKVAREKLESEWGSRLQTIVNRLASDHENDVGEAIIERETARAKVHELTSQVRFLEQKLEEQRRQPQETAGR